MARFRFGQIILAYISDAEGTVKERPCVVISTEESIKAGEDLLVVAVTKSVDDPCPAYHIPLPWSAGGDPVTGLDKPNVAKVNWIRQVRQAKVIKSLGDVPDDQLDEIIRQFEWLENREDLDI